MNPIHQMEMILSDRRKRCCQTVYDELRRIAAAKMAGERRDEALADLEKEAHQVAELVKLRYFVGMTMPKAAEAMELPLRTAERLW